MYIGVWVDGGGKIFRAKTEQARDGPKLGERGEGGCLEGT